MRVMLDAETRRKILDLYHQSTAMREATVAGLLALPLPLVRDVLDSKI